MLKHFIAPVIFLFFGPSVNAENLPKYTCCKIPAGYFSPASTDDEVWSLARWSTPFVDLKTGTKAELSTRVKMLWSDSCFYLLAEMKDPHLWASITKNEERIFLDNAFELFIDPDGDGMRYVEYEINAFGTTWDLLIFSAQKLSENSVSYYDMRGVQKQIKFSGTLNNPNDVDEGWMLMLSIPFENFRGLCPKPYPTKGDTWRLDMLRIHWELQAKEGGYKKVLNTETGREKRSYWSWSPHGVVNMHKPERFGIVEFK